MRKMEKIICVASYPSLLGCKHFPVDGYRRLVMTNENSIIYSAVADQKIKEGRIIWFRWGV